MNSPALSLSELTGRIKEALKASFPNPEWIVVEIAELKVNAAGHCYMDLIEKDVLSGKTLARARAIIWAYTYRMLKPYFETSTGHSLSAGLRVRLQVLVEFHESFGLSLQVQDIDPSYTLGDLARQRMETIARLEREGVYNMNREIPLPLVPQKIAVISSETAAGYEDFLNHLKANEHHYSFAVTLFPALMQGEDAPSSVIAALDRINIHTALFDVVVIIRGGGAVAELSIFDDYWMACHVAQFPLPVLTGIGHEKDDSIVDLVAHTRFKTPTAVAAFLIDCLEGFEDSMLGAMEEMAGGVRDILSVEENRISSYLHTLRPSLLRKSHHESKNLGRLFSLYVRKISAQLQENHQLLRHASELTRSASKLRLAGGKHLIIRNKQLLRHLINKQFALSVSKLEKASGVAQLSDPLHQLRKGYSITMSQGGVVKDPGQIHSGELIETIVSAGTFKSIAK